MFAKKRYIFLTRKSEFSWYLKTPGYSRGSKKAVALSRNLLLFVIIYGCPTINILRKGGDFMSKNYLDYNSLSHTTWECKYHIVFAPKYRRKIIFGKYKVEIGKILRRLCEHKDVKIIEAEM